MALLLSNSDEIVDPDRLLCEKIAQGDREAFALLYRRYHACLCSYVWRFVSEASVVDDVVADCWLTVWQRASTFRGEASAKTWLFSIVYNRAIDELRRADRRRRYLGESEAAQADALVTELRGCPHQRLYAKEIRMILMQAMGVLTWEHRQVLMLAYHQDLTYQKIADILSIPINTVKSRLRLAKAQLKRHLTSTDYRLS